MINLFDLKKNKLVGGKPKFNKDKKTSKHFPSPLREWKNSIYVYNKDSINLIPSATTHVNSLIKNYFNLYNKHLEAKMRKKRLLLRLRRLSSNRIYISNGEFKHTNNKVIINLYAFNRQKNNYLSILKKQYLKALLPKKINNSEIVVLVNRLKLMNKKAMDTLKSVKENNNLLAKSLNTIFKNKNSNADSLDHIIKYTNSFYKDFLIKSLKRVKMYFFYKQLLHINKSKLSYTYLQYLKNNLENIYNKNVEFNIIDMKRFYLNSDILTDSFAVKLTRKRTKLVKYLTRLKDKVNVRKNVFNMKPYNNLGAKQNVSNNELMLKDYIIDNLKYKHVTGFRLETKGRLTKRYTASRSAYKLKYKGSLTDVDSSYRGLSSVLLKGNLKSHAQYTKLKSKTRIGSFGIKGWVIGN